MVKDKGAEYIASLIIKFQQNNLSEEEQQALDDWIAASEANRNYFDEWTDEMAMSRRLAMYQRFDTEESWKVLAKRLEEGSGRARILSIGKGWIAAASLLLILAAGGYWFLKPGDGGSVAQQEEKMESPGDVKAPGGNRASLTMADGSVVYLDSQMNGQLAVQESVQVLKLADGSVQYKATNSDAHTLPVAYNTLINPKGSRVVNITLSDGTRVWLNAGSSITYPVSFSRNERRLSITGEGYFEVAHDNDRPFRVIAGGLTVGVLGTHFNVKAYADDHLTTTTLLEGSVKVNAGDQVAIIRPGQQVRLSQGSGRLETVNNVNTDEVMAWKEGLFQFNNSDIQMVMRELSRWYDVEVLYPEGVPEGTYWGSIRRDQNLSDVFKVLEESGAHFKITGKQVTVLP